MSKLGEFCTWDALGPKDIEYLQLADTVIEAAKALHAKMNRGEFASTADEQAGVWQAVEALLDVEGEE